MNNISILFILAIFGRSLAAPTSLCASESTLDPTTKDQLEVLLAYKYPDYYEKMKELPCFDEELEKAKYLVDPLWNEIPEEIQKIQYVINYRTINN